MLKLFARSGGELATPDRVRTKTGALKQGVSDLRGRLRELFGLPDDPFHPIRKTGAYRCRFAVRATDGPGFPTPPGATWDDVTLAAADRGVVRVAVRTTAAGVTFVPADAPDAMGRYEAATEDGEAGGRYTPADLGLVDDAGRPTAAAGAMGAVLGSGGGCSGPVTTRECWPSGRR